MSSIFRSSAGVFALEAAAFSAFASATYGVARRFFSKARAMKPARIASYVVWRSLLDLMCCRYGLAMRLGSSPSRPDSGVPLDESCGLSLALGFHFGDV